jgi:hypothetical protein
LVGIDVKFNGKTAGAPLGRLPIVLHDCGLNWIALRISGALPSNDPAFASSAVPCSKKMP